MQPRVLILHANGTNRDLELAQAFELAGAHAEIIHLNQLRSEKINWQNYQLLALPGGFSYADVLGAGRLFALDLKLYFEAELQHFIDSGKPVIGICNGFQALVKTGILPGAAAHEQTATLTFNEQGHFECRWVTLLATSQKCLWTRELEEPIYCPVAHGEGRFILSDPNSLSLLEANDQIALRYANSNDALAMGQYPFNPNGSIADIAGVCNREGNVLGLMPHPEDHIVNYQHPRWTRGEQGQSGLALFKNGVNSAR